MEEVVESKPTETMESNDDFFAEVDNEIINETEESEPSEDESNEESQPNEPQEE